MHWSILGGVASRTFLEWIVYTIILARNNRYYKGREPIAICSTVNHLRLSSNSKKFQSHDPALELYEKISILTGAWNIIWRAWGLSVEMSQASLDSDVVPQDMMLLFSFGMSLYHTQRWLMASGSTQSWLSDSAFKWDPDLSYFGHKQPLILLFWSLMSVTLNLILLFTFWHWHSMRSAAEE